jgi:pSer/pThr/pTyr-binding forkhead associated (FHA) protein
VRPPGPLGCASHPPLTIKPLGLLSKTHAIIFYEPPEAAVSAGSAEQDDGGWGSAYLDRDAADPLEATPTKTKPKEEPRGSWAIVDLGSTHGTFIRSQGADAGKSKSERLSAAKVASLPRTLAHGDVIRIGSSRFEVRPSGQPGPALTTTLTPVPIFGLAGPSAHFVAL